MKLICIILAIFLYPFFINADEIFSEKELFAKFKEENSCWYNTEESMVEESEKIKKTEKKFNLEVKK
jgi:hypothetical protein